MIRETFNPAVPEFPLQSFEEVLAVLRHLTTTGRVAWEVTTVTDRNGEEYPDRVRSIKRETTDDVPQWAGCPLNVIAVACGLSDWASVLPPHNPNQSLVYCAADYPDNLRRAELLDAVGDSRSEIVPSMKGRIP